MLYRECHQRSQRRQSAFRSATEFDRISAGASRIIDWTKFALTFEILNMSRIFPLTGTMTLLVKKSVIGHVRTSVALISVRVRSGWSRPTMFTRKVSRVFIWGPASAKTVWAFTDVHITLLQKSFTWRRKSHKLCMREYALDSVFFFYSVGLVFHLCFFYAVVCSSVWIYSFSEKCLFTVQSIFS